MSENPISDGVIEAYEDFYKVDDKGWRLLGAMFKAQHIVDVCNGYTFNKVLEVGAGDGSILYYLDKFVFAPELHALEISQSGIEAIQKRGLKCLSSVGKFDGYKIPFGDDEFDLVILSHVLEHVEFERSLLREIKRVSKMQVIEVPKDYRYGVDRRMNHFLAYGHINMYTPSSLRFLLQSEGLDIKKDKLSLTNPAVSKFIASEIKQNRGFLISLKIHLEYRLKTILGDIFGRKKQEQFVNAYTVLTEKTSALHIF